MANGGGEIIIRGGSCEICFDPAVFPQDENDYKKRKHNTLKIKQIIISGDSEFANYDTGEHSDKYLGTVRIICE